MSTWRCHEAVYRYPDADTAAIDGISLEIHAGGCTAIIGPNGSGKSTLLRLLLGILRPTHGEVVFHEQPLERWSRAALARQVGVVPQGEEIVFPLTVRELVAMGRYPHLGAWRREGATDRAAIHDAMERCDLRALRNRPISTLSGGERQLARVARALAQEPGALALDEPTVALDIHHEMAIFELLRELAASGTTVLLVTHNLNLAARYADRVVLLSAGRVASEGTPAAVLQRALVEEVYNWPVDIRPLAGPGPDAGTPQVVPMRRGAGNRTGGHPVGG
jgi:iron complex transport system ATP-binding protein